MNLSTVWIQEKSLSKGEFWQALKGSIWIAISSLVWIPTLPIATTMQTFAVVTLALLQSPRVAFLSCLFYLAEASIGLPVLCGQSSPLWWSGPSAGYLFAFPLAAYVMALLPHKFLSLFCGHVIIYFFGFLHLTHFIGLESAWKWGVLIFIPIDLLKSLLAYALIQRRLNDTH